jgi:hypothetical protein
MNLTYSYDEVKYHKKSSHLQVPRLSNHLTGVRREIIDLCRII